MTKVEFAKGLMVLTTVFNRECGDLLIEGYYAVLKGLESEEWQRAHTIALRTCRFMPTPSELYDLARPKQVRNADAALKEVRDAFLSCGRNRTPQWSDPSLAAAVELAGGWSYLCGISDDQFQRYAAPTIAREYLAAPGREVSNVRYH